MTADEWRDHLEGCVERWDDSARTLYFLDDEDALQFGFEFRDTDGECYTVVVSPATVPVGPTQEGQK